MRRLRLRFLHLRAVVGFLHRRPDVVHFQWFVDRVQDLNFMKLLRRAGIPVFYTAHDVEPHLTASPRNREELQRLYDSATKIVVHTASNKRELLSVFDVEASKVAVIPHGSYEFLRASEPLTRDAARERIGIPARSKVILFFGLIKRYKGLEHLVEAFEKVRESMPDAFLLIVGEIYAGDPEAHRDYTRIVDGLRGREDVRCIPSYVPVADVNIYFSAADVVVLPYIRTYHSGVLLAACAAGRPVVATDTGGLCEVVEEGRSGLVVPPGDAQALADGIRDIFSDSERLKAMGEHARHLATTVYGWDSVASQTIDLYRSVAAENRRAEQKGAHTFS